MKDDHVETYEEAEVVVRNYLNYAVTSEKLKKDLKLRCGFIFACAAGAFSIFGIALGANAEVWAPWAVVIGAISAYVPENNKKLFDKAVKRGIDLSSFPKEKVIDMANNIIDNLEEKEGRRFH